MKLLMIATDPKILDQNSAVAERTRAYGAFTQSLTVILAGLGTERRVTLSPQVHVWYPGGRSKVENFFRMVYAARMTDATVATAQDPFYAGLVGVFSGKRPLQVQLHTSHLGIIGSVLARVTFSSASCIRVVSEDVARRIRSLTSKPVSVLPIYVDPQKFTKSYQRPTEFGAHPIVLVMSRLAPEKRVALTIRAMLHIPDAHLYVVGDGPLRNELGELAKTLTIFERVHFLGWKADTAPYYAHADCFVQVSRYEGYGMALLEATLAGCPAVTTDVGIARELSSDSVTVVRPDEYELVDAIKKAITPGSRERARNVQSTFASSLPTLDQYLTEYKRLLETC